MRQHQPSHWHMVAVRPNHEMDAADSFQRNGVRCYWPNYERFQTMRDARNDNCPQRQLLLTPIIPGYVFAQAGATAEDFTTLIDRIVGVVRIARTFFGAPVFVSEADIRIIRRIEAALNTPDASGPVHNFKLGEKVRFTHDLVGRWPPGRIVRFSRDGRINVEVDLMGRKVVVIARNAVISPRAVWAEANKRQPRLCGLSDEF